MKLQRTRQFFLLWFSGDRWKDILKVILALTLTGFVLSKTNIQQIIALRGLFSWQWLFASFVLFCVVTIMKGAQYWVLFDNKVPYSRVFRIVALQNTLANLVSNTAGIASYLTMFRVEENVKLRHSGAIFIITKAGDLFSMGFFLLLSAWLVWARVGILRGPVLLLLSVIFGALILFWTAVFLRQKFVLQIQKAAHGLNLDRVPIFQRGLNMLQSVAEEEQERVVRMFFLGILLSMAYMTFTMALMYSRIQIFHIPIDFWAIIFIASLMQLVSIVPIQIFGGLGVTEFTLAYLYSLFGVVQVDIPAILVGLRVFFYLFNLALMLYVSIDAFVTRFRSGRRDGIKKTD